MLSNKRNLTFLLTGILMLLIVIISTVWAINFLIKSLNQATDTSTQEESNTLIFKIERAESFKK